MKAPDTPFAKAAIAALALLSARVLLSDDAVGVLGVQSGPAGSGVFAMPFEPFGHASPDSRRGSSPGLRRARRGGVACGALGTPCGGGRRRQPFGDVVVARGVDRPVHTTIPLT